MSADVSTTHRAVPRRWQSDASSLSTSVCPDSRSGHRFTARQPSTRVAPASSPAVAASAIAPYRCRRDAKPLGIASLRSQ